MSLLKKIKTNKGQSLVEAAITAPLIVFFLFSLVWFARVALTWQQIISASRFGIDLITYTDQSKENIEIQIYNYLCDSGNVGRTLDRNKLTVTANPKDCEEINYTITLSNIFGGILNPGRLLDNLKSVTPELLDKSSVEITYQYKIPFIFKVTGTEYVTIRHKAEVLSGSGVIGKKRK